MKKCGICYLIVILTALGALNGTLTAYFGMNLITTLTGGMPLLVKIVYGLTGVAAVLTLISVVKPVCPCTKG